MRNDWGVYKDPIVYWIAALSRPRDRDRLHAAVRAAGLDTGAWRSGGERDQSGAELPQVQTSVVSVFDHDGGVVTRESSCAVAVPGSGPRMRHHPPLSVSLQGRDVVVTTATDLWFPCGVDGGDNRVLAARNAPRLNEFLTRVRRAVRDLGGEWFTDPREGWPQARNQLDDRRLIRLAPERAFTPHRWGEVRRNRWPGRPVGLWVASLPSAPMESHREFAALVGAAGAESRACVIAEGRVTVTSLVSVVDEHGECVVREVGCLGDLPGSRGCHQSPIEVSCQYGPGDPMTMRMTVSLWVDPALAVRVGGFLAVVREQTEARGGTWTVRRSPD